MVLFGDASVPKSKPRHLVSTSVAWAERAGGLVDTFQVFLKINIRSRRIASRSHFWNALGERPFQIWNGLPPVPAELERRPEERVGRSALFPNLIDLRRPERFVFCLSAT